MPRSHTGNIEHLLETNRSWVTTTKLNDPSYFSRLADSQSPEYLWLGCSDSRVIPEAALGLHAGDLFVHRNIGNVLSHADMNSMAVLEYGVKVLGVKHVLVCGHTNCGAIKAALTLPAASALLTSCWISKIRDVRDAHGADLAGLPLKEQIAKLTRLNVGRQVVNVCTSPVIQQAWQAGAEVHVHGLLYDVATGALTRLVGPVSGATAAPANAVEALATAAAKDALAQAPTLAAALQSYSRAQGTAVRGADAPCVSGVAARRRLAGSTQPPRETRSPEDDVIRVSDSGAVVRRRAASSAQQREELPRVDSASLGRTLSSTSSAALPPDVFTRRLAVGSASGGEVDAGAPAVETAPLKGAEPSGRAAPLSAEGVAKRLRSVPATELDMERRVAARLAQHAAFEAAATAK